MVLIAWPVSIAVELATARKIRERDVVLVVIDFVFNWMTLTMTDGLIIACNRSQRDLNERIN